MAAISGGVMIRIATTLLVAAVVAGCCPGKAGQDQSDGGAAADARESIKSSTQINVAGVKLQAIPSALDTCTNNARSIEIAWDGTQANVSRVKISVTSVDGDTKVWMEDGPSGKQTTGVWVVPGTQFTLSDNQDKQLAQLTIGSASCKK
jgi:hypothetical protein